METASIDEYIESLKFTERDPVTWDYDREADVLYISFGEPEPAIVADAGEGVLIRFRESDGMIVGITIMNIGRKLQKPRPVGGERRERRSRRAKSPSKPR